MYGIKTASQTNKFSIGPPITGIKKKNIPIITKLNNPETRKMLELKPKYIKALLNTHIFSYEKILA